MSGTQEFDPFSVYAPPPAVKAQSNPDEHFDPFAASGYVVPPAAAASTSPAVATMPAPIGVTEFGAPIFANDTAGTAANKDVREGELRAADKFGQGLTFGLLPHAVAGARALAGTPYSTGLQEARDFTQKTSDQYPLASLLMEGAGAAVPTTLSFGAAGPAIAAAGRAIPAGSAVARALLSGGLGAASEAGHDVGSGNTTTIGRDMAVGAGTGAALSAGGDVLGKTLQAVPNMASGLYQGIRNVATSEGRNAVAGQILREASGEFPNQTARTAIPDLTLRAPQATGNPGLAALESTMASEPGIQTGPLGDLVTNNRTPNQVSALGRALVGSDAGIDPAVLTNQSSARGVAAIQNSRDVLRQAENDLWNAPELSSVRLRNGPLTTGINEDIAGMPPSFRGAIQGGPLNGLVQDLHALPEGASIADVNAVRSRILEQARASRASGDNVTATAAQKLADSVLNRTENALGNAGAPVQEAYSTARDFTRQRAQAFGQPEFDAILRPNSAGNMRADPEAAFNRFIDTVNGRSEGLGHIQGVSNLLRLTGQPEALTAAQELENATRSHINASILRQSRAGSGLDATGQPSLNLASMASTANRMAPALNATPMTAGMAPDVQAAGNAAELLNRPSIMRGSTNSTTYERLRNHDLVSAIIGQSGSSALGGAAGGYAGYRAGDAAGVPAYASIPAGILAGAAGGRYMGPSIGQAISHIPIAKGAITGPTHAIQQQLWEALSSMPAYERALATPLLSGPAIGAPGALSRGASATARMLLEPSTAGSGR